MTILAGPDTLIAAANTALATHNPSWTAVNTVVATDLSASSVGLIMPNNVNTPQPVAYWNAATFPNDQWAQCTINNVTANTNNAGVALRMSTTSPYRALYLGIQPQNNTLSLYYTLGWPNNSYLTLALVTAPANQVNPSPALAAGDVIRFEVHGQGAQTAVSVWRGGAPNGSGGTQVPNLGGTVVSAAQVITAGTVGVSAQRITNWGIKDFAAGDFVFVTPPVPPASAKGAFTVRTV